jgi:sn-glycerol 3-phosphate transport system permease protein
MKTRYIKGWQWHVLLLAALIIQLWPLLFMFSTSFKTMDQIFASSLNPIPTQPVLDNYRYVLQNLPLGQYTANTFFVAGSIATAKILTSILAGFAFVYYEFPHKEKLFNALLLTFFIPITVIMLPNYLLMAKIGAMNTAWGVILPQLADGMGIFLMRQSMRGIPRPLLEAARLENAGSIAVLWRIVLPLIKPSVIAMGIVFFINAWNDYFWPMLILGDKAGYTLPLALQMFISAEGGSEWGVAMAVAALASLPPLLLYLACQRFIINTFIQSGVKG